MSNRLRLVLVLGTLILFSLTMAPATGSGPRRPLPPVRRPPAARWRRRLPSRRRSPRSQCPPRWERAQLLRQRPVRRLPQTSCCKPGRAGATGSGEASTYTVVAGDTLLSIATRFGTTTEAIAQLNNLPTRTR